MCEELAKTKLNHKIWVKGFLCVKVVKVRQPNLTRSEKHETEKHETPNVVHGVHQYVGFPNVQNKTKLNHKMWVNKKQKIVRGDDDDDDDDEIKTSMFIRVYHISNWSCGFVNLIKELKPTT